MILIPMSLSVRYDIMTEDEKEERTKKLEDSMLLLTILGLIIAIFK
jgi:hypothetical protein